VGDNIQCGGKSLNDQCLLLTGLFITLTPSYVVVGTVSKIDGSTVQILNGTLSLDLSQAEIVDPLTNAKLPISSIIPGMFITPDLHTPVAGDSMLHATSVVTKPLNQGFLVGRIEQIDIADNTITLLGHKLMLNGMSRFDTKRKGGLSSLKVGEVVGTNVQVSEGNIVIFTITDKKKAIQAQQ